MHRDRGGLDQRAFLVRDGVGHPDAVVLLDERELPHPAPWPAQPDDRRLRTEKAEVALSIVVLARADLRLDGDPVAGLDRLDPWTDRDHAAGELVTEDLRQQRAAVGVRRLRGEDGPGFELVQVGSADSAEGRRDDDFAVAGLRRLGRILDPKVVLAVVTSGFHGSLLPEMTAW